MEYVCVSSRFLFFNGKDRFTVEFSYGLMEWFIFKEHETSGAIFTKKITSKNSSPNRDAAGNILSIYLNT
jgi:hypothetical protein